jgi:hypothetical protein
MPISGNAGALRSEKAENMLTEKDVSRMWRDLFQAPIDDSALVRASELIDELPATSPLRQRYASELSDLRRLTAKSQAPAPAKRGKTRTQG